MTLKNLLGISLEPIAPAKDVGLHAHGYRTMTSKPGDHQTAIQTLPTTFGIDVQTVIRPDKLRKQRNLTEYTGDIIPESAVSECLSQAEALYAAARNWLKANKPDLLRDMPSHS